MVARAAEDDLLGFSDGRVRLCSGAVDHKVQKPEQSAFNPDPTRGKLPGDRAVA